MERWLSEPVSNGSIILFLLVIELIRMAISDFQMREMLKHMIDPTENMKE